MVAATVLERQMPSRDASGAEVCAVLTLHLIAWLCHSGGSAAHGSSKAPEPGAGETQGLCCCGEPR